MLGVLLVPPWMWYYMENVGERRTDFNELDLLDLFYCFFTGVLLGSAKNIEIKGLGVNYWSLFTL